MAGHTFCPNCGTKNEHLNGAQANFCFSCGTNLKSLAVFGGNNTGRSQARQQSVSNQALDLDDGSNEQENETDGLITRADVQIVNSPSNKVPVENILNTAKLGHDGARRAMDAKGKRVNGKKAFDNYKSEAGTIKNNQSTEIT